MSRKAIDPSVLPNEPVEIRLYHAKENCSPEILRVLSKDSFWFVRNHVAANLHTPVDCLQELLTDPDFRIQKEAERTLHKQELEKRFDLSQWQQAMAKLPLNERLKAAAARASGMHLVIEPENTRE